MVPLLRAGDRTRSLKEIRLGVLEDQNINAANAGGVINGCRDLLGWDAAKAAAKVDRIYDTVLNIFDKAATDGIPTYVAADRLVERRLGSANETHEPKTPHSRS